VLVSMLRKRIEATVMPDEPIIVLDLDKAARRERDARRRGGESRMANRVARGSC
jgi:hypothetical protein